MCTLAVGRWDTIVPNLRRIDWDFEVSTDRKLTIREHRPLLAAPPGMSVLA